MVEGALDRSLVFRLLAESKQRGAKTATIDLSDLVSDPALSGMGARQKVRAVGQAADNAAMANPAIAAKLACLTDREWDDLRLDPTHLEDGWAHARQSPNRFVTAGHSIENYYFHPEALLCYLRHFFPENYGPQLEERVRSAFPAMLALAGALSFVANAEGLLSRMCGLLTHTCIDLEGDAVILAPAFNAAAVARGVPDPDNVRLRTNRSAMADWNGLARRSHACWILHGHVGSDVLWACVGRLAMACGIEAEKCERIARGDRRERDRCWQDWLAVNGRARLAPLDLVARWVGEDTSEATPESLDEA